VTRAAGIEHLGIVWKQRVPTSANGRFCSGGRPAYLNTIITGRARLAKLPAP
jgi:hypothetical protein